MNPGMENLSTSFLELIDREPIDLTPDERDCLEYHYASVNIAQGLPADSHPRRWCLMAQSVGRVVHMLGRPPEAGDPGVTPEILTWIAEQSTSPLNSYQRAWLNALPGMSVCISR